MNQPNVNLFLANIISIFHFLIILFVLLAPFSNIPAILILHITFVLCLMVHWYSNSNVCCLTVFESQLRGLEHQDTYSYKFISPIYDISMTDWSNIIWIITFILLCISIYKLYNTDKFKKVMSCYSMNPNETFYNKIKNMLQCAHILFIID